MKVFMTINHNTDLEELRKFMSLDVNITVTEDHALNMRYLLLTNGHRDKCVLDVSEREWDFLLGKVINK